ncbi:MAG: ion transporter, partial [Flavobacteriales bacterium]|nr:ion transporter [Flavobacteriales bacterium]
MARNFKHKEAAQASWRKKLFEIIFEADTPEGKRFDVVLFWMILLSVFVVMLESVEEIQNNYRGVLIALEWAFTVIFTLEYAARIVSLKNPKKYMTSFFGIIDLLSILPTYLALIMGGAGSLMVIRVLRFMRIFRVLKLIGFMKQAIFLTNALKASRQKILVFLMGVLMIVTILGTVMYIVE